VDVNYLLPRHLGAGLLWGRGSSLGLLGGSSLHHVGGHDLVLFVVVTLARVVIIEVVIFVVVIGHVVVACVVSSPSICFGLSIF
jgi:hypothetical protein